MAVLDAVRRHYESLWGAPSRTASYRKAGYQADIYKWDAERHPEGVNFYATIGASAHPMPNHAPAHRMEFYFGLRPAADEIASPLAALALYPVLTGEDLDHDHTVPADRPLWAGTGMRTMLISHRNLEVVP